jgi:exodeoxyribonuclease-5
MLELTKEQKKVRDGIMEWVLHGSSPYIALSGYAGTGKTTVLGSTAALITKELPLMSLHFASFTGKASLVLSQKLQAFCRGVPYACSTLHSYMYRPKGHDEDYELQFETKEESEVGGDLLIVDEASMISSKLFHDIMALGKPTIFVGDPGQLPPINDTVFQPLVDTELSLSTVHRQAIENPIINLATRVRNQEDIPYGIYKDKVAKFPARSKQGIRVFQKFQQDVGSEETVVLCGKNATRVRYNTMIRAAHNLVMDKPVAGERLICLRNDKDKGIFNGQCVYVQKCDVIYDKDLPDEPIGLYLVVTPEGESSTIECIGYVKTFNNSKPKLLNKYMAKDQKHLNTLKAKFSDLGEIAYFDYGYAMSVHKSQGSEWERVLLKEEHLGRDQTKDDYYRWLYTGITRAKDKLVILGE